MQKEYQLFRKPTFHTFFALILLFSLSGCTRQILLTSYYLIEYQPRTTNQNLILEKPLPYLVQVRNFKIPRSYDSIRIIARYSSHQINYYRYSLWAVRPQIAIADLMVQHINAYRIFKNCQREFLQERPQYEITGKILQIERYESDQYSAAHLKVQISLYDYETNEILVNHTFDREVPIPQEKMTIFAKAISDVISVETEIFLEQTIEFFIPPVEEED